MSELHTIESALQRAAQRRRLDRALRGAWKGLLIASLIWLVALIVYKVAPIPFFAVAISGAVGLGCVLLGAIIGGWRKAVRERDGALGGRETEFERAPEHGPGIRPLASRGRMEIIACG